MTYAPAVYETNTYCTLSGSSLKIYKSQLDGPWSQTWMSEYLTDKFANWNGN